MNIENGDVKNFETFKDFLNAPKGPKNSRCIMGKFWVECAIEPTKEQYRFGVKHTDTCLCGSGKMFKDCCFTVKPEILDDVS